MHTATHYPVTHAYRGMRLDRFLQCMLPRMSRASIQEGIATRVMLASGLASKASRRLTVGDTVTISPRGAAPVLSIVVPVLARGDGWIVADKPAGIASTPSSRRPGEDVATLLQQAPAHRLDRFTSGCLVLTSQREAARAMDRAFQAHRIEKQYLAVVHGMPPTERFDIEVPLGIDVASRVTGKVCARTAGLTASTHVEVMAHANERTLLRVQPRTGRRHQIRAHLAHIGHPIIGDLLYGDDERQFIRLQRGQPVTTPPGLVAGRHLLHACRIVFPDPTSQERVEVCAPWPTDLGFRAEDVLAGGS